MDASCPDLPTFTTYRRSDEVHRLWLYSRREALTDLQAAGLQPRTLTGYRRGVRLRAGHIGFAARKQR